MRGVVGSVLVAVLLESFTEVAAQLPPEIMTDRYLVQAERLMKEKDFKAALEAMEKIVALQKEHDLKLPTGSTSNMRRLPCRRDCTKPRLTL